MERTGHRKYKPWDGLMTTCINFVFMAKHYGIARIGGISFKDDTDIVRFKDLGLRINERFIYEYDFTDGWQHQIRVEASLAPDPISVTLFVSMAGEPVRLKIVAVHGHSWSCVRTTLSFI